MKEFFKNLFSGVTASSIDIEEVPRGVSLLDGEKHLTDEVFFQIFGILGRIPKDYGGQEYWLHDLIELPSGNMVIVLSGDVNTDVEAWWWSEINDDLSAQVVEWYKKKSAEEAAFEEKEVVERHQKNLREEVLKKYELDEESIRKRREEVLRKAGLL